MDHYANLVNIFNSAPASFSYNFGNSYSSTGHGVARTHTSFDYPSRYSNYCVNNNNDYCTSNSFVNEMNVNSIIPIGIIGNSNSPNTIITNTNYGGLTYNKISNVKQSEQKNIQNTQVQNEYLQSNSPVVLQLINPLANSPPNSLINNLNQNILSLEDNIVSKPDNIEIKKDNIACPVKNINKDDNLDKINIENNDNNYDNTTDKNIMLNDKSKDNVEIIIPFDKIMKKYTKPINSFEELVKQGKMNPEEIKLKRIMEKYSRPFNSYEELLKNGKIKSSS